LISFLLIKDCLNDSNVETFLVAFGAVPACLLADRNGEGNCVARLVLHTAMYKKRTSGVCQFQIERRQRKLFTGLFTKRISHVC
jgi:hypothetical protein